MRSPVTLMLVMSAMVLTIVLVSQSGSSPVVYTSGPQDLSRSPVQTSQKNFSLPPLATFTETLARPLFSPVRKAGDGGGLDQVSPLFNEDSLGQNRPFSLNAILIEGPGKLALIKLGEQGTVRVQEGDLISGWTVLRIYADRIEIGRGSQVVPVKLRRYDAPEVRDERNLPEGPINPTVK